MKKIVLYTLLIERSPQALPLGSACIASSLKNDEKLKNRAEVLLLENSKEDNGFVQENASDFIAGEIIKRCGGKPDFVLFSVFVWNHNEIEGARKILKEKFPEIIIIAGGPEVTADPLRFSFFDYTVSGQGEEIIPRLINQIIEGEGDLLARKNHFGTVSELEKLPSPYLDGTINLKKYGGALWELARGCPFKCSYCYESKGEKKIRYFPIERIEKELKLFNKEKISQVFVLDPTYNAGKKRALQILDLISKNAPGMFFYFEARAEFIDREMASAFTKIKCALQFGLQSADPEVLKNVNRTIDRKIFARNIGYLNEKGVIFGLDLIFGLPGDTLEGFKKSIDYALNLYPNNLETFCLSVLPGTDLFDSADNLNIEYEKNPPYHVIKTDKYSASDLKKSENLSHSCNIFYNQGRAVPWFNTLCRFLHRRPVLLLEDFYYWFVKESGKNVSIEEFDFSCRNHQEIEQLQLEFVRNIFARKKISEKELKTALSIIKINGALSRVESDGIEQTVQLDFHPDDLLSEYAMDISFFAKNAKYFSNKTRCFISKCGVDWKVVK